MFNVQRSKLEEIVEVTVKFLDWIFDWIILGSKYRQFVIQTLNLEL